MSRLYLTMFVLCLVVSVQSTFAGVSEEPSFVNAQTGSIAEFSENVLLSKYDTQYAHHVEPTLAISDNGTLFAGWKDSETAIGGGARVSFAKSVDGGEEWTNPFYMPKFESADTRQSDPWLVWHDDTLYYAYLEFSVSGDYFTQITVANTDDYGNSWNPVKASDGDYFADKETMTIAEDGTIYVAYDDVDTTGDAGAIVRLTKSEDGGESFEEISVVDEGDAGNVGPYVTLDSDSNIYVAWTRRFDDGGNLLLSKSLDQGATFDEGQFINDDGNYSQFTTFGGRPAKITIPVIRFDQNDRLYVLWSDTYDQQAHSFDIYLRYSDDYGETWSQRFQVNPDTIGDQWQPEMAIDSEGGLHIVYYDEVFEEYRPYYRTVTFTGDERDEISFSDAISIAENATSSEFTRPGDYFTIKLDSQDIPHVVWTDGRNDEMDIFYAHGIPAQPGTTTTDTAPVTDDLMLLVLVVIVAIAVIAVVVILVRRR